MRFICPICLKKMYFFTTKTECGHKFHTKCLKKWKDKSNKCPSCSTELFNYNATYHEQHNVTINLKHNNNSVLIKNNDDKIEYKPIRYADIPYIQSSDNTLIITEIDRTKYDNNKLTKFITTPHAMDIFRQLTYIFYECHHKNQKIKNKEIDVDNIIRETKTYTFEDSYSLMPVRTIKIN
jgi:hypothetical protein